VELKEVLAQVPGLEKRFVYYLEALGYIQPRRVPKRRIARRDYTPEDVARIQALWRYYQRGYSLQAAQALASRPRHYAYALLSLVPAGAPGPRAAALAEAYSALCAVPEVALAGLLYGGAGIDAVALVEVAEEAEVYEALGRLLARGGAASAPVVLHVARRVSGPRAEERGPMQAYVLIKLPAKEIEGVLAELQRLPAIAEAAVVYGETDIIARVVVRDQAELDELVFRQLHAIPTVESTRTFIVVGDLYWRRPDGEP
jgi:DNA-binding Lrp family transcriptional regulator